MKGKLDIILGLVVLCILFVGISHHVMADAGLPDGFEVLKKKMEQKEIPNVDFAKLKFDIPDNLPEEINNIKATSGAVNTHIPFIYRCKVVLHIFFS